MRKLIMITLLGAIPNNNPNELFTILNKFSIDTEHDHQTLREVYEWSLRG